MFTNREGDFQSRSAGMGKNLKPSEGPYLEAHSLKFNAISKTNFVILYYEKQH
jgi:hypothetical protein